MLRSDTVFKNKRAKENEADIELRVVLSTGNSYLVSIAKSILNDAQIPFIVKNEQLQNLFGIGSIGGHVNPLSGPIEIMVKEEDENTAKELLENLKE